MNTQHPVLNTEKNIYIVIFWFHKWDIMSHIWHNNIFWNKDRISVCKERYKNASTLYFFQNMSVLYICFFQVSTAVVIAFDCVPSHQKQLTYHVYLCNLVVFWQCCPDNKMLIVFGVACFDIFNHGCSL